MVQLALGATELPQVLDCAKSPLAVMLVIARVPTPVLVSVTVCAAHPLQAELTTWLPKVRLVGEKLMPGAAVPAPASATVCGLPPALSVTERAPVRDPVAVGVKVTEIVQVADGDREVPQPLLWLKSPLAAMLIIVSVAEPVLVSVTVCAVLVVLTV